MSTAQRIGHQPTSRLRHKPTEKAESIPRREPPLPERFEQFVGLCLRCNDCCVLCNSHDDGEYGHPEREIQPVALAFHQGIGQKTGDDPCCHENGWE